MEFSTTEHNRINKVARCHVKVSNWMTFVCSALTVYLLLIYHSQGRALKKLKSVGKFFFDSATVLKVKLEKKSQSFSQHVNELSQKESAIAYLSRSIIYTLSGSAVAASIIVLAGISGHADQTISIITFCTGACVLVRSSVHTQCVLMAHLPQTWVNYC